MSLGCKAWAEARATLQSLLSTTNDNLQGDATLCQKYVSVISLKHFIDGK